MQRTRDDSIWKNLALAFGDGLAFGAGVNLSNKAASRVAPGPLAAASTHSLGRRLTELEQRLERARQTNTLPGAVSQKAIEAMVEMLDTRLREHAAHFEQRLKTEIDSLRSEFSQELSTSRKRADDDHQVLRTQMTALHRQFAESLARLVDEQIAATIELRLAPIEEQLRAESPQPAKEEMADLQRRVTENDQKTLDLVLALGQLCLQTAERLAPLDAALQAAPAPTEPATAEEPPKPLWRIPLVSSFFVATGGLLLLHYL